MFLSAELPLSKPFPACTNAWCYSALSSEIYTFFSWISWYFCWFSIQDSQGDSAFVVSDSSPNVTLSTNLLRVHSVIIQTHSDSLAAYMYWWCHSVEKYSGKVATLWQKDSLQTSVSLLAGYYYTWVEDTVDKCSSLFMRTHISFPWKDETSSWRPTSRSNDFCPLKCHSVLFSFPTAT